ncbi:MAG: hypothetical protein CMB99_10700 [Flavobacteriaceae bacterium]|nr:hypothetical protein [Flavobacteriaceae bacterium]|tara:strand:- start:192647 stop:194974 length:2328 start_codon:yes stop_codon:yes gene_type:complete
MKKYLLFFLLLCNIPLFSQVDYSQSWEDFYSYNNVKDFVQVDGVIYALTDNAIFTYTISSAVIEKFSSVQGLSGETTSAIFFHQPSQRLIIGYENGLIEVVDENDSITISSDIVNFSQSGAKRINDIYGVDDVLYVSTPFAIIEYDIEELEFGDTFFIGSGSSAVNVFQTTILNNTIYAVTEDGIFTADRTNPNLIDFNNWTQQFTGRSFSHSMNFNNTIYVSEGAILYELDAGVLNVVRNFSSQILDMKADQNRVGVSFANNALALDANLNDIQNFFPNAEFAFNVTSCLPIGNDFFLGTRNYGVLKSTFSSPGQYEEIHPEGPLSNDAFFIAANNQDLWVVYGGYNNVYTPSNIQRGYSHFNGTTWVNKRFDPNTPYPDLNYVTIDPNADNKVYISSMGDTGSINTVLTGGLLVVENDEVTQFYNHLNSPLEDIVPNEANRVSVRISGTMLDRQGNLWVTNIGGTSELKKLSSSGQWSSFDISSAKTADFNGLSEVDIDRNNNIWFGSRNNGAYAFNENTNTAKALIATPNLGNLPDATVLSLAIDANNSVWLGTRSGLVVFRNPNSIFTESVYNANPIVIEDNGIGERLLGDQRINSIVVDGADNKWFGTDRGGVLYTNPSGRRTLANFSTENSPLPSNRIIKIAVDENSGKVFFATDKGIVAYNSNVAPFGEELPDVYAYPNPVLKNHNTVTINGRNGQNLPKGTNVKILDVAGNLVFESNVIEGQELQGGKVVWDKRNLAGTKVASGIYIVLLSTEDGSESGSTKIAIVN